MQQTGSPPQNVSRRHYDWLERESREWEASGAIPPGARPLILERYSVESAERRGMIAMVLIAASLCSVGLLLLIGYNWDEIPRAAKLALLAGSVAAAFGGAAVAYAKERNVAGESLAFLGTLLYGNAIWLVAQVLHIGGRYPDAFLWWALGTLATAWLVRSQRIGALAALLVLFWTMIEGGFTGRLSPLFLILWPMAIAVAYGLGSPVMLRLAAPAAALWVFFGGPGGSASAFWLGGIALTACALYSTARWQAEDSPMRDAWEGSGLLTLLVILIPLTITAVHRDLRPGGAAVVPVAIAAVAALVTFASSARPSRSPADQAVLAVAGATAAWILASWSEKIASGNGFAVAATILFSVLTLVMSAALVRSALTSGEIVELGAGVAFAVLFLAVRWASVIENLFWSGVLMLAAGGGLLLVARLWRRRPRPQVSGRLS